MLRIPAVGSLGFIEALRFCQVFLFVVLELDLPHVPAQKACLVAKWVYRNESADVRACTDTMVS